MIDHLEISCPYLADKVCHAHQYTFQKTALMQIIHCFKAQIIIPLKMKHKYSVTILQFKCLPIWEFTNQKPHTQQLFISHEGNISDIKIMDNKMFIITLKQLVLQTEIAKFALQNTLWNTTNVTIMQCNSDMQSTLHFDLSMQSAKNVFSVCYLLVLIHSCFQTTSSDFVSFNDMDYSTPTRTTISVN